MNFHEYQAKQLFAEFGIPVPPGQIARTPEEAVDAAKAIGGDFWVVKAQIHAGGRGKAGGVKLCRSLDEVRQHADAMLGTRMSTYQTAGVELPVDTVLVTKATDIAKELYLSMLVDRAARAVTFIASAEGGVEIEQVAEENPDAIKTLYVNYVAGLQPYQCRELGFALGLSAKQVSQLTKLMLGLFKLFNEKDLALVELNPLAILKNGELAVLDGKVNSDDNATFRHPDLAQMRDIRQEDPTEVEASQHDLNYVTMDGDIGCMVNGDPARGRFARELPGRGRRRDEGAGDRGLQADPVQRQGARDLRQHLRRHRALRHDRRGHHRGGEGSGRRGAGDRAPGRHQRGGGQGAAAQLRPENHRRRRHRRRRAQGGRRGQGRLTAIVVPSAARNLLLSSPHIRTQQADPSLRSG
jgi:hypothetical protein